jgi:hypothetical protein
MGYEEDKLEYQTEALLDATSGRWYGVLSCRFGGGPPRILHQTDPQFASQAECLAAMKRMLEDSTRETLR